MSILSRLAAIPVPIVSHTSQSLFKPQLRNKSFQSLHEKFRCTMIKFLLLAVLYCVAHAQIHAQVGSFLGSNNRPLCVREGNHVIIVVV